MSQSPNAEHSAKLIYEGEIRFGPTYFKLELDGHILAGHLFGRVLTWSPCSKYLALEEWLTIDYSQGPRTRLFLINLEEHTYSEFKTIENGFVRNVHINSGTVQYVKEFPATGYGLEAEIKISKISNWRKLDVYKTNKIANSYSLRH
ncbi:hypothetical protein MTsDn1_15010 [Alteromonas sp. MTD1]|uniref:hypothetical protein n=1 Tax=Alteromonas sp. MTD1 TaxID=3057962 RepID=UPI0036F3D29D